MGTRYEQDVVAWAREQAALLREGKFSAIDVEHIAKEIDDVAKSEQRDLLRRISLLLAHLLKRQYQPGRRGSSWRRTIEEQRRAVGVALQKTPSLQTSLRDADWLIGTWADAVSKAV